nr:MAG: metallophosphoesterase [[Clostridium] cellulosi]
MRIVVISDTHGNISNFERAIFQQPKADLFIHLGDHESDVDDIRLYLRGRNILSVSGNCDFGSQLPDVGETVVSGKRIFYTHGHRYHVKFGIDGVINEARRREADIVLFGHTHIPVATYEKGLYIMNPGSLGHPRGGSPTYGIIDITNAGVVLNIVEVES